MGRKKKVKLKSLFESRIYDYLTNRRVKFEYEKSKVPFTQPARERVYNPDFEIEATGVVIEAKGYLDAESRKKLVWVKEQHPNLNLVLLFQDSRKTITRSSKTTYGQWATKHGFEWADFRTGIPERWYKS